MLGSLRRENTCIVILGVEVVLYKSIVDGELYSIGAIVGSAIIVKPIVVHLNTGKWSTKFTAVTHKDGILVGHKGRKGNGGIDNRCRVRHGNVGDSWCRLVKVCQAKKVGGSAIHQVGDAGCCSTTRSRTAIDVVVDIGEEVAVGEKLIVICLYRCINGIV